MIGILFKSSLELLSGDMWLRTRGHVSRYRSFESKLEYLFYISLKHVADRAKNKFTHVSGAVVSSPSRDACYSFGQDLTSYCLSVSSWHMN